MSYVSLRRAAATTAVAIVSAVALAGPATAAAPVDPSPNLPQQGSSVPAGNGIIMSDGRICNPRWGC